MDIRIEETARQVDAEAALRWWTDFREGHHDHDFLPGARRRLLPSVEGRWRMREEVRPFGIPLFLEEVTAWRDGARVAFEGRNTVSTFEGAYAFAAVPDGTRIALEASIRLRKGLGWGERVARPIARRILAQDLRGHARQLERDLAGA